MYEKFLLNTVIKKYSQLKEINYLKKTVSTGLHDYEEIIIDEYCRPSGKALVSGCGAGRETIAIGKKGIDITAIDIINSLTKISKEKTKKHKIKCNFLTMNAIDLGFKENTFDYVFLLSQLISLIPLKKNRIKTLNECKRVMKKDGLLILSTHSRERNLNEKFKWFFINLIRKIHLPLFPTGYLEEGDKWVIPISGYRLTEEKIFMHLYTEKEAIEDIKKAGLKIIKARCATEIVNKRDCPEIREKDKYILYIAQK